MSSILGCSGVIIEWFVRMVVHVDVILRDIVRASTANRGNSDVIIELQQVVGKHSYLAQWCGGVGAFKCLDFEGYSPTLER